MNNKFSHTSIKTIMSHLNELTSLDIQWLDSSFSIIHKISLNQPPLNIDLLIEDYHAIEDIFDHVPDINMVSCNTKSSLEYLIFPFYITLDQKHYLQLGPFRTVVINETFISNLLSNFSIPLSYNSLLTNFFTALPLISDGLSINLGFIAYNLLNPHVDHLKIHTYSQGFHPKSFNPRHNVDSKVIELQRSIEDRYRIESELMHAIESGNLNHYYELITESREIYKVRDRIKGNPLRSAKNIAFVYNTICRIATGRGGLHPIYLHSISEKYALLIERSVSKNHIEKLFVEMPTEYIEALNKYTNANVSPTISRIIDYIHLHLDGDLQLKTLSEVFQIKSPNLANKFKRELNLTVSEFVNQQRIHESKHLLKNTNLTIKEISSQVGYTDQNYFTRLFKKQVGISPTCFR